MWKNDPVIYGTSLRCPVPGTCYIRPQRVHDHEQYLELAPSQFLDTSHDVPSGIRGGVRCVVTEAHHIAIK